MYTFIAFIFERILVSLPDILMAGGGAFLLFNKGKTYKVGYCLLFVYFLTFLGAVLGPTPPSLSGGNEQVNAFFSYGIGWVFGVVGGFWGHTKKKRRVQQTG